MVKDDIQNYPTSDSPNHDAFEGIVELYYEIKGYITSSGKWFWKKSKGKQQRGYQDIDVLAINGEETIIVSVTSNFDDKLSYTNGSLNQKKSRKTLDYFERVYEYLQKTYKWLTNEKRTIKKVIAVINAPKDLKKYQEFLNSNGLEILNVEEMISEIIKYLENNKQGLKIQNQTLRILQILKEKEKLTDASKL